MTNKEFYDKYVDTSKFYTIKELELLMVDYKKEHNDSIPGPEWMNLCEMMYQKLIFSEEIYKHFGEESMMKLIKNDLERIFKEFDYKNNRAPLFSHIYAPIQNILLRSAKMGYLSLFKYMVDNVRFQDYDIDRLNLFVAIKDSNEDLINMIIENTDKDYGRKGALPIVYEVQRQMLKLDTLNTLSDKIKEKLIEQYDWMRIKSISGIDLSVLIKGWEKMSNDELNDLIDNHKKDYTEKEFSSLKSVMRVRLEEKLKALQMEIQLKGME